MTIPKSGRSYWNRYEVIIEDKQAEVDVVVISWCFMPSQLVRLYQGKAEV